MAIPRTGHVFSGKCLHGRDISDVPVFVRRIGVSRGMLVETPRPGRNCGCVRGDLLSNGCLVGPGVDRMGVASAAVACPVGFSRCPDRVRHRVVRHAKTDRTLGCVFQDPGALWLRNRFRHRPAPRAPQTAGKLDIPRRKRVRDCFTSVAIDHDLDRCRLPMASPIVIETRFAGADLHALARRRLERARRRVPRPVHRPGAVQLAGLPHISGRHPG